MEGRVEQDMIFHAIPSEDAEGSAGGWIYLDGLTGWDLNSYVLLGDFSGKVLNRNNSQTAKDTLRFSQQHNMLSSHRVWLSCLGVIMVLIFEREQIDPPYPHYLVWSVDQVEDMNLSENKTLTISHLQKVMAIA